MHSIVTKKNVSVLYSLLLDTGNMLICFWFKFYVEKMTSYVLLFKSYEAIFLQKTWTENSWAYVLPTHQLEPTCYTA